MIIDGISFSEYANKKGRMKNQAMAAFAHFFEQRTGTRAIIDRHQLPYGRPELADPFSYATRLIKHGIISGCQPAEALADEPPLKLWVCTHSTKHDAVGGGGSLVSDPDAIYAALAEGLERYLWHTQTDYFQKPKQATQLEIARYGAYIAPQRFLGFSAEQRAHNERFKLGNDASYLWIRGLSLVTGKHTYIPAQVASSAELTFASNTPEPLIRMQTSIGLATFSSQTEARLRAVLECVERDAYIIMWLNQLILPRVRLTPLRAQSAVLNTLIEQCERYQLKVHALSMPTDAPAHATCVIVEDLSGHAPRFMWGLKAHRSLVYSIEKALLEALRGRRLYRGYRIEGKKWDPRMPIEKIGHIERTLYWGVPTHAEQLACFIEGPEVDPTEASWEADDTQAHIDRIIRWCKERKYECVAVSPGVSKANPLPWHVQMVVTPDLQPAYLHEGMRHVTGSRITEIPRLFGYRPLSSPYIETPHPFV